MLAVLLVLVIAAYAVLRVSSRLAHSRARAVYDLAEAVDFISERLPEALTAKLSYEDVEAVLLWRLDYLRLSGSATYGRGDIAAREAEATPSGADIVTSDDDAVDYALMQADKSDRDIEALDVVVVLDLERVYLEMIGALGPPAGDLDDPQSTV